MDEKYDVRITRTDFKVNKQKIDTKFLEISNRYMEALFPIEGIIDNYRIKIINLPDIKKEYKKKINLSWTLMEEKGLII